MQMAYFSECLLPGQNEVSRVPHRAAHQQQPRRLTYQGDALAQQQAIYEELLASQQLPTERERPTPKKKAQRLSVRELIRDLAGWTIPPAGALRASNY